MSMILTNLLNAMKEIWANIGVAQRTSIVLILLATIGAMVGVIYLGTRPDWQPLYADLPMKTAAEVHTLVQEEGIPVKTRNGGRTILVPAQHVNTLKHKVTLKGIEGVDSTSLQKGFNIFDVKRIGMSQDEWLMMKQRAIQGELAQMIGNFDGVSSANVLLNIPKRRAFNRSSGDRPSAAVQVSMKQRGMVLSAGQVNSVRSLVAGAVEGLEMNDVTVTDGKSGRLLAERLDPDEAEAGVGSSYASRRRQMERALEEKAEGILASWVGADNVVAVASLELDVDKINEVSEKFDTTGSVVKSEKTTTEETTKTTETPGGVVGTGANTTRDIPVGGAKKKKDEETLTKETLKTTENEYEIPKTTITTSRKGDRVKHMTVAVVVNQRSEEAGGVWSPEDISKMEALVKSAVGARNELGSLNGRTDTITVEAQSFAAKEVPEAPPITTRTADSIRRFIEDPLVRPVFGIVVLLGMLIFLRGQFRKEELQAAEIHGEPYMGEGGGVELGSSSAMALASMGEQAALTEGVDRVAALEKIRTQTTEDPAVVAGAIEAWVNNLGEGSAS